MMVLQDRDCWEDLVSVPGEVRQMHKPEKPRVPLRSVALIVFLGLSALWLVPDHVGLGRLADGVTELTEIHPSLAQSMGERLRGANLDRFALLANADSEKPRLIYQHIVGLTADAAARLWVDATWQGLQDALKAFWQETSSWIDRNLGDLLERAANVPPDLLFKGAVLVTLALICLGVGVRLRTVRTGSLQQLDASIGRLGTGDLANPIKVTGPRYLRHLGQRLEWLRARLWGRETSQQQRLSQVSREFETPLSGIFESTGLLAAEAAGPLNPKQRALVARLRQHVQQLQSLIEGSLRYNQLKDHPAPHPKDAIDMRTLLASVIAENQDSLQAKSLTVQQLVQPVEFVGIPDQVRAIVDSLLSNAIQFSPEGGKIRILLRALGVGMQLEVEDDGPGIDAAERPRIFEPFFRGQAANTMAPTGAGLGLAIVSECVANHQGKVESLEPRQDEPGARIRVELPLTAAS